MASHPRTADHPYHILLAEDSELDRELIQNELEKLGLPYALTHASDKKSYMEAVERAKATGGCFDLILSDYGFPDFDGLEAFRIAKEHFPRVCFIIVSAVLGEEAAIDMLREGVTDYVLKQRLSRLVPAVRRALEEGSIEQERQEAQERNELIERRLHQSERRYKELVEGLRDYAIITMDMNGTIISWNTGGERILGYTADEVIGKHFRLFFTAEDQLEGAPERELETARRTGAAEDKRWHIRNDGKLIWASGLTTTVLEEGPDGTNVITGFAKILRDQTDKRLADEERARLDREIAEERERLASLIGSIPGIVWEALLPDGVPSATARVTDLKLRYISAYVEKLLGYSPEEILAMTTNAATTPERTSLVRELLFPQDVGENREYFDSVFSSAQEGHTEYRLIRKDGQIVWVEAHTNVVHDAAGMPVGLRGVILDVTDRKQAEIASERATTAAMQARADAEESEQRYRHLAEAMPQIVYVLNPKGETEYFNRQWYEYTGQKESGANWADAVHPEDLPLLREEWARSFQANKPFESQIRLLSAEGAYHWFLNRTVPLTEPSGDIVQWIGTSTDIQEQKHSEEALQFLARASDVLSSSLDYQETLRKVAELAVPRMADWCSVEIINGEGKIEQLAVTHVDPEKVKWAHEISRKYPPDQDAASGVPQVIRTGKSEFYPYLPEELLRAAAKDEEHWRIIQEIGFTSFMIVPLRARDIVFGAISFVTAEGKHRYTEADLKLAEDLGRRAAMAVDNAWLYQKAQLEIEERTQTEAALRESEERYRIVAETATDAILTIDESSTILFVNPAGSKIFGYSVQDMTGKPVTMLMPGLFQILRDRDGEGDAEATTRHLNWEGVELPGLHRDGHEIPLEISFGEFTREGKHIFTGIVRDITERQRVESELRSSESRFRTMIEQSPLGIQLFDLEGYCIKANRAWEELWGTNRESLIGYNIRQDPQLATKGMSVYVERAYAGEAVVMPPVLYDPAENGNAGRPRWIRVFLYPVKNEEQGIQEVAIILEDITERRQAEEELRRAKELAEANEQQLVQANQAKDHFLAILSHELRTPLTPVMATVQALQLEDIPDDMRPWLEIIQRNVELEARLIDDLLDLTRITKGKLQLNLETVDAHALIQNVLDIYRSDINAKGLDLHVELNAKQCRATADPARLQQVFWNLVKNAVKFTDTQGKLIVHTSNVRDEVGKCDILRIEVTDTGIGIDPELLPRIFDAFEQGEKTITRNFGGLGLGLAISKSLVDLHGGTLTAISPGKDLGATFIVELMTTDELTAPTLKTNGHNAQSNDQKRTILLIDDHLDTSTAIRMLLERQGYHVIVANSAGDAVKRANEHPFDLIVSDIGLPDESGLSLIGKLRAIRRTPAIALSGFGTEEDVMRSREAGFQEHLTKPFNLQKLREAIARLLANSERETLSQ